MPLLLSLALQAAIANEAPAKTKVWLNENGWYVYQRNEICSAFASYTTDETDLGVFWIPRTDTVRITVHDKRFKSLKEDEENVLSLYFKKPNEFDDGWGDVKSRGDIDPEGKPGFRVSLEGATALDDIAASNTIAFFKGDTLVVSLSLKASAQAVSALRKCGADVIAANPIDPFER